MSKSKAISVIVHESDPEKVGKLLIAYGDIGEIHDRLKLLFRAAQGACLLTLREAHGHLKGGGVTSARCGGASWEDHIKKAYGFSADTAARRIEQWKRMVPLMEKLGHADQQLVADFLRRPMLHLNAPELKALEKVTNKIATLQDEQADAEGIKYLKKARDTTKAITTGRPEGSKNKPVDPQLEFIDKLMLPLLGGGDGTIKTIWSQFDEIYAAWNEPVPMGASKVALWQTGDTAKRKQLAAEFKKQKAILNQKIDHMIAQVEEVTR